MNTEHSSNQAPVYVLICAAGVGARAGGDIPKQYQLINGIPMLAHSIRAFTQIDEIQRVFVVVSPEDDYFAEIVAPVFAQESFNHRVEVLPVGGATRAESVRNGLETLDEYDDDAWVMVHDAARPCVSQAAVLRLRIAVLETARAQQAQGLGAEDVGGLLAIAVSDTIKCTTDGITVKKTIDRSQLCAAQTPQMFKVARLYNALCDALMEVDVAKTITDEASVMEWAGDAPILVQGETRNLKVTYPDDFALAGFYLAREEADERR